MTEPDDGPEIGWVRAVLSGLAIVAVGIVVAVGGANEVLNRMTGLSRDTREYVASGLFFATVFVEAWALRRLQARRLI